MTSEKKETLTKKEEVKKKAKELEEKLGKKEKKSVVEEVKAKEKELEKLESKRKSKKPEEDSDFVKVKKDIKLLVSTEDYRKAGIYIGTRVITQHMMPYVYRRKADGLAVINIEKTDQKLRAAINLISKYPPEKILVVCKREAGWPFVKKFSELLGVKLFTKKYPAGIITNPELEGFFEPELILIVDPWIDKKALNDALKMGLPIISLCDTNNITHKIDLIIPTNNKSGKSIALIFYILAKGLIKKWNLKNIKFPSLDEFIELK